MSKNSIQVAIKVRPLIQRDKDAASCWRIIKNSIQSVNGQSEPYYFDHIFDQDVNNQIIFNKMAKNIIHSAFKGFNGTIFAYGQTSSGKTYTMMGDDDNPGVMVLAAKEIFKEIEACTDRQFLLRVGYIEIYNEKIYDLLNKKNQDLKIHETSTGIVSVNCEENIITSENDLLHFLCMGNKERTVGETNMNERSSRSHAIFRIIIESRKIDRTEDDTVIQSVLNLVDLAGSERADQTGARGTRLKEGGHINKSLHFLSNVIKRLSENEDDKYVSFRDSKLTRILQASLGGNSLTSIICTIKSTAMEETQSTLSFAMRAKSIKNKPQVNEIVSDATMMKRLEREIKDLKTRLDEERRRNESQVKVGQLEQRIKSEVLKIITCNSLHNIRLKNEKRRRTWCSATSNSEVSGIGSNLPLPTITTASGAPAYRLRPAFTPHITIRNTEKTPKKKETQSIIDIPTDIDEGDEYFEPGELCTFETPDRWNECKTPEGNDARVVSLTPVVSATKDGSLKLIENAYMELQEFTNLEKKIDVKHETYDALKQKLEDVNNRNVILEEERLQHIQTKDELELVKKTLGDYEMRCGELEVQVTKLKVTNEKANSRIAQYEEDLSELKTKWEQREAENQDTINLEFEFERHKNKSKQRELELVELLSEKDKEIATLEKSLKTYTEAKIQKSKEDLMQLSYTECTQEVDQNAVVNVCVKCEDLQRLLDENRQVLLSYEKAKLEYQQLQIDHKLAEIETAKIEERVSQLESEQDAREFECNELRGEIAAIREKLKRVQQECMELASEKKTEVELREQLEQNFASTCDKMRVLQERYDTLQDTWQKQQQSVGQLQTEYDDIQGKYQRLQEEYNELCSTSTQSQENCSRLQKENDTLLEDVNQMKARVGEMHEKLLANIKDSKELDHDILEQNTHAQELNALRKQYNELQSEYDVLSNQLMDNLQEAEMLRDNCKRFELELQALRTANNAEKDVAKFLEIKRKLEDQIVSLKTQLQDEITLVEERNSRPSSCGDVITESGISECTRSIASLDIADARELLLTQFATLAESLEEIELEHCVGKSSIFTAKNSKNKNTQLCKLFIRNIENIESRQHYDDDIVPDYGGRICMQGIMTRSMFHIIELEPSEGFCELDNESTVERLDTASADLGIEENRRLQETVEQMKELIQELTECNDDLKEKNKMMSESTERTINELREQIANLTAELFEKSQVLDRFGSFKIDTDVTDCSKIKTERELMEDLQSQCNELEGRCINAESSVALLQWQLNDLQEANKSISIELTETQKELDAKAAEATLELMEKLENIESANRETLRKCKNEWEKSKDDYENTILELQNKLEANGDCNTSTATTTTQIEEQLQLIKKLEEQNAELVSTNLKQEQDLIELASSKAKLMEVASKFMDIKEVLEEAKQTTLTLQKDEHHRFADLQLEIEQFRKHCEQLEDEKIRLLDARNELQQQIDGMHTQIMELTAEQNDLNGAKCQLEMEKDEMLKEISTLWEKQVLLENEMEQLQVEHDKLLQEKTELVTEAGNTEEQLVECKNKLEQQIKVMHKQIMDLTAEQNNLNSAKCQLDAENKTLSEKQLSLENKVEQLQLEQDKLLQENNELVTKADNAEDQLVECKNQLQQQIEDMHKQIMDLTAEQNNLNSAKCRLDAEKDELLKENKTLSEKQLLLEDKCAKLLQENNELVTKVASAETKLAACKSKDKQREELVNSLQDSIKQMQRMSTEKENLQEKINSLVTSFDILQQEKQKISQDFAVTLRCKASIEEKLDELCKINIERDHLMELLQQKVTTLDNELQQQRDAFTTAADTLKRDYEYSMGTLRQERDQLQKTLDQCYNDKDAMQKKSHSLQLQVETLNRELDEAKQKVDAMDKSSSEQEEALRKKTETLSRELHEAKAEIDALSQKLHEAELQASNYAKLIKEHKDCEELLAQANNERSKLLEKVEMCEEIEVKRKQQLDDEHKRFEAYKCSSVAEQEQLRNQLDAMKKRAINEAIAQKQQVESLQVKCTKLKHDYDALQKVHQQLQESNKKCQHELKMTNEKLKEIQTLHAAQLAQLQKQQQGQEVWVSDNAAVALFNNSAESNSSNSPRRKFMDRECGESIPLMSMNVNLEDKLSSKQMQKKTVVIDSAERKNRRLSMHDERRRQSSWMSTRDIATMTDPTDPNCNCEQLNMKLRECEKNLFIEESKVTALNMQIKCHPLKTENIGLKKRLEELQDKHRHEVKHLRQIILEQTIKTTNAMDSATTTVALAKTKHIAETQTEFDLDESFHKLQSKYNDLKNICRHRYNTIKQLEDKLQQQCNKENMPHSSMTEADQSVKPCNDQCESLRKDLRSFKQKYEEIKIILNMRLVEIQNLRAQLKK